MSAPDSQARPAPAPAVDQPRGRILCVTSTLPRWSGDSTASFVLHLAQDLQALGWRVDVLAPHAAGAATLETMGGVRVERFRYLWPATQQTVCYGGGALINLRKSSWNAVKVPFLVAAELGAVLLRLASQRYDLVHSHWIVPQGLVGTIACALARKPHLVTVHGGDIFGLRGALLQWLKRLALRGAGAITVNSGATQRAVRELIGPARTIVQVPMGVATEPPGTLALERAQQLRARWRRGQGPLLVFVGRLVEEKGPADLLRAVAALREDLPDVSVLLVGDGPERAALERLARELGLADRAGFAGWVDPPDVPAHLAAADIFVAPSRRGADGWVEAQGLAVLEAMASGVPVIATRLGGVSESVEHERTGLLVDEQAPLQIAAAVRRLAGSPQLGRALAAAAQAQVRHAFSRPASAAAFSQVYAELLALADAKSC